MQVLWAVLPARYACIWSAQAESGQQTTPVNIQCIYQTYFCSQEEVSGGEVRLDGTDWTSWYHSVCVHSRADHIGLSQPLPSIFQSINPYSTRLITMYSTFPSIFYQWCKRVHEPFSFPLFPHCWFGIRKWQAYKYLLITPIVLPFSLLEKSASDFLTSLTHFFLPKQKYSHQISGYKNKNRA